jgi:hypothetical protein
LKIRVRIGWQSSGDNLSPPPRALGLQQLLSISADVTSAPVSCVIVKTRGKPVLIYSSRAHGEFQRDPSDHGLGGKLGITPT